MSLVKALATKYNSKNTRWERRQKSLDNSIVSKESDIEKLKKSKSKHWDNIPKPSVEILEPIAKKLSKKLDLKYEISGGFGLNNHYSLEFKDNKKSKTVYFLWLRPNHNDSNYWYGLVTNKIIDKTIPKDSIAYWNDDHKEVIPLPKTIPKIIEFMDKHAKMRCRN